MTAAAVNPPREARIFRPLTALLLVLAGVFSFSAYFVLSAYAPDLRGGDDGGANALSRSAVGYAGLVRLLQADGVVVQVNRDGPTKRDPNWGLLVLTPDVTTPPKDLLALVNTKGATLVVLPKWNTVPDPNTTGWVQSNGLVDTGSLDALLGKDLPVAIARRADNVSTQLAATAGQVGGVFPAGRIDRLQSFSQGGTPVLKASSGEVVLARVGGAAMLSDPDLMNTHGIADAQTAASAVALIQALRVGDGPVVFDVSLNGYKHSPSLLKLAFTPPFLGATLCLAGAALLMALHAAYRFGAPERATRALALGKRALAENSAGLIRMAHREPHMAAGYLELNRTAVMKSLGAGRLTGADFDTYADKLGERIGAGGISPLARETAQVKDREGLVRFAQRLYQWRLEMTRERR
ncbi:MAG TPA: DUF4350 domain-containing protein [Caulobacteraceae bacterium]|nr:DUF4350 domain-containing protein [Caulobacteraceae bacterium]